MSDRRSAASFGQRAWLLDRLQRVAELTNLSRAQSAGALAVSSARCCDALVEPAAGRV